jgi:predicted ATPase
MFQNSVTISSLAVSYQAFSDFPFSIPAIGNLPVMEFHKDVTFIIGKNGSGKSTFIEAVAEWLGLSGQGGSKMRI